MWTEGRQRGTTQRLEEAHLRMRALQRRSISARAPRRAAGSASVHAAHHLVVLLLFALAPLLFLLLALAVCLETKVTEQIRLPEQKVEPLLRCSLLVAHDLLVLRGELLLLGRHRLHLLWRLGLLRACRRLLLHARALLRPLDLALARAGSSGCGRLGDRIFLLLQRRLIHGVLALEASLVLGRHRFPRALVDLRRPLVSERARHHLGIGRAELGRNRFAVVTAEEHVCRESLRSRVAVAAGRSTRVRAKEKRADDEEPKSGNQTSSLRIAGRGAGRSARQSQGREDSAQAAEAARAEAADIHGERESGSGGSGGGDGTHRLRFRVCKSLDLGHGALKLLSDASNTLLVSEHATGTLLLCKGQLAAHAVGVGATACASTLVQGHTHGCWRMTGSSLAA